VKVADGGVTVDEHRRRYSTTSETFEKVVKGSRTTAAYMSGKLRSRAT
jgi:hypothetical protein